MSKGVDSIGQLRESVIQSRGGACKNCDQKPKFTVCGPTGFVLLEGSLSTTHKLSPGQLSIRVSCDATRGSQRRPYTAESFETCRARKHQTKKTD